MNYWGGSVMVNNGGDAHHAHQSIGLIRAIYSSEVRPPTEDAADAIYGSGFDLRLC